MQTNYKKIFQLNIQHEYFNRSNAAAIVQLGAPINGSGMGIKPSDAGYFLFGPEVKKPADEINEENISLSFPIQISDPNFFNYTDIKFDPGTILYFSNEQVKDGIIETKNAVHLPLKPGPFDYGFKMLESKKLVAIQLKTPLQETQDLTLPEAGKELISINLSGESVGKYQLLLTFSEGDNITYDFFYSNQINPQTTPAVFEWKGSRFTPEKPEEYTLTFSSREIFWCYVFPKAAPDNTDAFEITPLNINQQEITFNKIDKGYPMPGSDPVLAFQSSDKIPLLENPEWLITASSKEIHEGIRLPYATANSLSMVKISETESIIRSNIFIYT